MSLVNSKPQLSNRNTKKAIQVIKIFLVLKNFLKEIDKINFNISHWIPQYVHNISFQYIINFKIIEIFYIF